MDRQHRTYGDPPIAPNPRREQAARSRLRHPPVALDAAMRAGVDAAIRELCSHRGWYLAALAVRTEHVHVVILAANVPPEQVLRELKARSTQELRRRGLARTDERIWSRHGSTRYLWSEEEVDRACGYVLEGQGPELKD